MAGNNSGKAHETHSGVMANEFTLSRNLLGCQDVLEAVLREVDAAALCQLKATSVAWCVHARRELCKRIWVQPSRREGQPEPTRVDSMTDLDFESLNKTGRPWEVVIAGRQLPQLARLHGYGFVVDLQAIREAHLLFSGDDETLGGDTLRSCIQGDGHPPNDLLLAAVACTSTLGQQVHGVPVQRLREVKLIDISLSLSITGATLLAFMLPAATSVLNLT